MLTQLNHFPLYPTGPPKIVSSVNEISDLNVCFTVEKFSEKEAKSFQFGDTTHSNMLNAVQDFYISKREKSLGEQYTSIKKDVPKSIKYTGLIQTVEGGDYGYGTVSEYLTSTLKIGDDFYVFQLIANKQSMGYLYDDFISILSSAVKKS